MRKLKKTIVFTLLISLLLTLTACGKNTSATKAVDEYLKDIQKSPSGITMWINWADKEYRNVIEDLVGGIEYKIVGETDHVGNKPLEEKDVTVELTGYDIGGYYEKYLDDHFVKIYEILNETYTDYELAVMHAENEDEYEKLILETDIAYFKTVMEECKAAGKTYTCMDATFITYYSTIEKEWAVSINNGRLAQYIDYVTNGFNSLLAATPEQRSERDNGAFLDQEHD